jgi:hypothetical protein
MLIKTIIIFYNTGVQGKNNAYHNVNKVQNSFIEALILNLIDIVVCVVFAWYSRIAVINGQKYLYFKEFKKPLKFKLIFSGNH